MWDTYQCKFYDLALFRINVMAVSYLVAAKTNMEVLLEVVEAEAKLVVAKKTKVA